MTHTLPWLAAESPRRLAPALTRFVTCAAPWTPADIVSALCDQATRRGRRSPLVDQVVHTRPAVLLATMLRGLDEQSDYPGPAFPDVPGSPAQLAGCARPDCDGWITTLDTAGSAVGAAPCADPEHRRSHYDYYAAADAEDNPF